MMMMTIKKRGQYCEVYRASQHDKLTANKKTPPLLPVAGACRFNGYTDLLVRIFDIVMDLLTLRLNLHGSRILLHHDSIKVVEQLSQFDQITLNLLDLLVPRPHHLGNLLRVAASVTLDKLRRISMCRSSNKEMCAYSLAENLLVRGVLHSFLNFSVGGVGPHDAVLSRHLLLQPLSEIGLHLLVFRNGGLQSSLDSSDLSFVARGSGIGHLLDALHAFDKVAIEILGFGGQVLRLCANGVLTGGIGVTEESTIHDVHLIDVVVDRVDATVDVSTLVQDRVWIAARHGAHFCKQMSAASSCVASAATYHSWFHGPAQGPGHKECPAAAGYKGRTGRTRSRYCCRSPILVSMMRRSTTWRQLELTLMTAVVLDREV